MTAMMMNMWYVINFQNKGKLSVISCALVHVNYFILFFNIFPTRLSPSRSALAGGSRGDGCRPHPEGFESQLRSSVGRSRRWIWEGRDVCPGVCANSGRWVKCLALNNYCRKLNFSRKVSLEVQFQHELIFYTLEWGVTFNALIFCK